MEEEENNKFIPEDSIKIVTKDFECNNSDWLELYKKIIKAFHEFPQDNKWEDKSDGKTRNPSSAIDGNTMCAVNLCISMIEESKKYGPATNFSGDNILIITAGVGLYKVNDHIYKVYIFIMFYLLEYSKEIIRFCYKFRYCFS